MHPQGPQVERLRAVDTQVKELSKEYWVNKLDSSPGGIGSTAHGLQTFEEWSRKKKLEDTRRYHFQSLRIDMLTILTNT